MRTRCHFSQPQLFSIHTCRTDERRAAIPAEDGGREAGGDAGQGGPGPGRQGPPPLRPAERLPPAGAGREPEREPGGHAPASYLNTSKHI